MIEATKLPPELRANFTNEEILTIVAGSEAELIRLRARVKDLEAALQQVAKWHGTYDSMSVSALDCCVRAARKALEGVS